MKFLITQNDITRTILSLSNTATVRLIVFYNIQEKIAVKQIYEE